MNTNHRIPKQLLTSKQVREWLQISEDKLHKLDKIFKPIRIATKKGKRYDSDKIFDFIEKGGVK